MGALTAFDVVILLIIGVTAVRGVLRGFVTEVLSLFAWVAAVLAIRMFYEPASALAGQLTGTETGGNILAFALLFIVTYSACRLVARELGKRTRESVIGPIDRVLGFGFGALKGLIVGSLIFLLINLFFDMVWGRTTPKPAWLETSKTYPLLKLSSQAISSYVEERRNAGEPETAAKPKPEPAAYDRDERDALGQLLDAGK
ncbi:CvpA family protein [Bradyrhizobium sp.]|uniref:CvpA family protein n=1 Tax=Bradyrhizobium sp. TaxID=376 RepID=UPI0025B7B84B|nr:CvpA family protein [Bradyrhizobium sp.]MCA3256152.1 CvpA family protein [Alphaproteobacteria bacterium]MCA3565780.1 CvpA family protein [Bradyrhizobium sp.]